MEYTKIWDKWIDGKQYQTSMGLRDIWPQCIDFKEGRQWPLATDLTRNLPRPVFNICEKTVRTKRSNILNQTIKMIYSAAEDYGLEGNDLQTNEMGAKVYTAFSDKLWKDIHQDDLNEDFVEDCATLGTGILHYFWDTSVNGGQRFRFNGALRGETLDPECVVFGNPYESDVQKQPFIIIASRMKVKAVKKLAEMEELPLETINQICTDEETPDNYDASKKGKKDYCTVLTMYYKDGGVRYSKCTKNVMLIEGRSLTPNDEDRKSSETEYSENTFDLYPIVLMNWNKRKRSIYGIGEVEGLINAQKSVNWLMAMNILSAQDTAWPKIITRPGALRQEITNKPGEVIVDHSPSGSGISTFQSVGVSAGAMGLVDKVKNLITEVSGINEVVTGEPFTATMSASAIIALQNQAKQPIENVQKRFYRCVEQVGRIWEQFFKFWYDYRIPLKVENELGEEVTVLFVGTDFSNIDFNLEVDVGAGSAYSESLAVSQLDKLFEGGQIDLNTYVELAPKNVMPFKEQLKRKIEQYQNIQPNQSLGQEEQPRMSSVGVPLPEIPQARGYTE